MTTSILKPDLYTKLEQLPENLTCEILGDQLYTEPHPSARHLLMLTSLVAKLGSSFVHGCGDLDGWWILHRTEIHFELDQEVVVSDIAGWLRERMPEVPDAHKIQIVPDWICEIMSPASESKDWQIKMPLYAKRGVKYLWMVHPIRLTLDAYELKPQGWDHLGHFDKNDTIQVKPFDSTQFTLGEIIS